MNLFHEYLNFHLYKSGPLVRIIDGKLFGVTSFGFGCAEIGKPGVYAYVLSVRDWIRKISSV